MAMTRSPEPTANLVSEGDQRTNVAARAIRRRTSVGLYPVGEGSHTRALRSVPRCKLMQHGGGRGRLSVFTLGASDDASAVRGNVYTSDGLVVPLQLVLELKAIPLSLIKLDRRISGYS